MEQLLKGLEVVDDDNPRGTARRIGTIMAEAGWKREKRGVDQKTWYIRPVVGEAQLGRRRSSRRSIKGHLKQRIQERASVKRRGH